MSVRVSKQSSRLAVAGFGAGCALIMAALGTACVSEIGGQHQPGDEVNQMGRIFRKDNPVPNQYIVVLKTEVTQSFNAQDTSLLSTSIATSYNAKLATTYTSAIKGFVANMSEADAIKMSLDPMVEFIEEDGIVQISATQNNATWGIDRLDSRTGTDGSYTYPNDGSGVTAYIIDTGIVPGHPQFGNRAKVGFDAVGGNGQDCNGHGTHVAGTVGSSTYGVAKNVQLYGVRVLDCQGSGTDSGVIAGVDWVTANAIKPAVANMSLGGGASTALDNAIKKSIQSGITYAVAAGNENQNACNVSPARLAEALTVGSTTSSDGRSSFSNWGTCVDIFAPGSSITSTWLNNGTSTISGTSMASPHVCGAAALYLSANPSATPAQVAAGLINSASTNEVSNPGSGSPNRLLYIGDIGGGGNPPPPPPPPPPGGTKTLTGSVAYHAWFKDSAISVKPGTNFKVVMTGSGDPDLYVRFNNAPTLNSWQCRPWLDGPDEECSLTVPSAATTAYVGIYGYSAGTYTAVVTWTAP